MFNPPGLRHQRTLGKLLFARYGPVEEQGRGTLLGTCGVVLSPETLVIPNLLFISRDRRHLFGETYVEGPPDLVAEILSAASARFDRIVKRDLDAKHGVRHYWVVEPNERWMRAYELGADGFYELVAKGHGARHVVAPPFPELVIRLGHLWDAVVDD
jgi:Uma2 family endonuclease